MQKYMNFIFFTYLVFLIFLLLSLIGYFINIIYGLGYQDILTILLCLAIAVLSFSTVIVILSEHFSLKKEKINFLYLWNKFKKE